MTVDLDVLKMFFPTARAVHEGDPLYPNDAIWVNYKTWLYKDPTPEDGSINKSGGVEELKREAVRWEYFDTKRPFFSGVGHRGKELGNDNVVSNWFDGPYMRRYRHFLITDIYVPGPCLLVFRLGEKDHHVSLQQQAGWVPVGPSLIRSCQYFLVRHDAEQELVKMRGWLIREIC